MHGVSVTVSVRLYAAGEKETAPFAARRPFAPCRGPFFWKPYSAPGGKLYSLEKGRAICALTCNCSDTAVREQQPLFAVQQSSLQQICYTSSPQSSYHMARRMILSKRAWPSAPAPPPSTLHCTLLRTVALSSVAQRAPRRVPGARSAARRKAQRGGGVLAQ